MNTSKSDSCGYIFIVFCLIGIVVFSLSYTNDLYAQTGQSTENQAPVSDRQSIDLTIERIRLYYGLGQYAQVINECKKLEQIDPDNKMASYYRTRAEARLGEIGVPETTGTPPVLDLPPEGTPIFERTPPAITPGVTPVATTSGVPTTLPVLPTPVSTRAVSTPSPGPFSIGSKPTPSVSEVTPEGVTTISPTPTPEVTPVSTPFIESRESRGIRGILESLDIKLLAFIAVSCIFILLLVVFIILLFRRASIRRGAAKLKRKAEMEKQPETEAQAPVTPIPQGLETVPQGKSEFTPEVPDFAAEAPEFAQSPPQPIPPDEIPPPPAPEAVPSFEGMEPPPLDVPEPADIPSPSAESPLPPIAPEAPELPDIPSPTKYPSPEAPPVAAQPSELSHDLPPDLPTLEEAEEAIPPPPGEAMPVSPQEAFDEVPSLPSHEEAPQEEKEEVSVLEIPTGEEESPFFSSKPAPGPPSKFSQLEPPMTSEPAPTPDQIPPASTLELEPEKPADQEPAPAISIDEALGLGGSSEEVSVGAEVREPDSGDKNSTSMDLDSFLFDSTGEDQADTVLAVSPDKPVETPLAPITSGESEEDDAEKDDEAFDLLMFEDEESQDTLIATPEQMTSQEPPVTVSQPSESDILSSGELEIADVDSGPHVQMEERVPESANAKPLDLEASRTTPSSEEEDFYSLETIFEGSVETKEDKKEPPSGKKIEERNEALFNDQFKKGQEAFDNGDWKKAVHYLTVASAIKPEVKELKEMLATARKRKRGEG
jgi:hypothetical protein